MYLREIWFRSNIDDQEEEEEEEDLDEDFSFLDETDYVIYEDCFDSETGESEECDKFDGKDYYDYEQTLKEFDTANKKSSPAPDEKSSKHGKTKLEWPIFT